MCLVKSILVASYFVQLLATLQSEAIQTDTILVGGAAKHRRAASWEKGAKFVQGDAIHTLVLWRG